MSIELPENTAIKGEAGFTMIETVMVLVLLGILGAVAVAKYFDLKEQASAIKCEHSRSVLISQLNTAFAVSKLEDKDDFSIANIDSTIDKELTDVGGAGCKSGAVCANLCPNDGTYAVTHQNNDGSMIFTISCSVHKGTGDTPSVTPPAPQPEPPTPPSPPTPEPSEPPAGPNYADPEDINGIPSYLFGLLGEEAEPELKNKLLVFFNKSKWLFDGDYCLDSGADDVGTDTKPVLDAMTKVGIDTKNLIWRMQLKWDNVGKKSGDLYLWTSSLSETQKANLDAKKDGDNLLNQYKEPTTIYQYKARYDSTKGVISFNKNAVPVKKQSSFSYKDKNYIVINENRGDL